MRCSQVTVMESSMASGSGESCANNTFSGEQIDQILIAVSSTGMVSMSCCLIAVLMVVVLRLYKKFVYRLALYQVLAALFFSFALSIQLMAYNYDSKSEYSSRSCEAVGFLMQYSIWVKVMFTACLTFHLFFLVVFFKNFQKLEVFYIPISVIFPLLHSWIPFTTNSYGMSDASCWIRGWKDNCARDKSTPGLIEQFALCYGPFYLIAVLDAFAIVIMVIVLIRRAFFERRVSKTGVENAPLLTSRNDKRKEAVRQLMPLLIYPLLFLLMIMFGLVDRVYAAIAKTASYPLTIIHAVLGFSWPFFAGLALILHLCLLREWKKKSRAARNDLVDPQRVNGFVRQVNVEPYTAATTRHVVPAESKVDACKLGEGGIASRVDIMEPSTVRAATTHYVVPAESEVGNVCD